MRHLENAGGVHQDSLFCVFEAFFQLEQLPAYIGQTIALRLISAVENRRKFQAKLVAVDLENETIQVEVEKQQVLEIDSHNIDKANLVYQD